MWRLKEENSDSPIFVPWSELKTASPHFLDRVGVHCSPTFLETRWHRLYVGRRFRQIADMITGAYHGSDHPDRPFSTRSTETDDPRDWAVFGRRICGWGQDVPLRYNNPSDVDAIVDALGAITPQQMRQNLTQVAARYPYDRSVRPMGYEAGRAEEIYEHLMPHLLPNLQTFFARAQQEHEFVIHDIG